ncbi:MBL fold metallo-hydrolase RNA specificity domain-containing protein [Nitrospira moscoviensis]|uniref:Putative RNA-metabolising metallo-beta-lactamase n=1 Tax=Nitrospira moscoviensis TaxID=42253 RepID=A0A0K2G6T0_NITMO|nr:MBL fold metallo-hydrolase [Nitrospira moscoviensis]ALA56681.1 putative RNA-metabolising metallo-beta-lactamase [Nitrospira moscoviensis]
MKLSFYGAARSVTGSRHLIETPTSRLLLDCGMFQGRREEAARQNRELGFEPKSLSAVLLSHAHIDHSGALPVLAKHGFSGKVHMTRASADLAAIMLQDAARIQESDCAYVNKKERRRGMQCVRPFFDSDDVEAITRRFAGARYRDALKLEPRVTASFHDAGHILGSAAIRVKYTARGNTTTVLFSGDLGRANMPILRDPDPPPPCDILILESTYGDRLHEQAAEEMKKKAEALISHARAHKSKIIVPAFAVGRTQELVMRIKELVTESRIEPIPIYIDSPLAARATAVFRQHPECYDEETSKTFSADGDPFASRYIHFVSTVEDSKRLNAMRGPCVIISSSGMCEGGRILHHLKHAIQDEANVIVFVGFQAEHTLGRKLVEGWDVVPIFGVPTPRRAQVVKFNGLSAHADRHDLLAYIRAIDPLPGIVFLVHGEEKQALSLGAAIQAEHPALDVRIPHRGSTHDV